MYIPAWLSGLFGKKTQPFRRNGRSISQIFRTVLDIEQLEKRIVPVIAGSDVQFGQSPMDGASYDGVVISGLPIPSGDFPCPTLQRFNASTLHAE